MKKESVERERIELSFQDCQPSVLPLNERPVRVVKFKCGQRTRIRTEIPCSRSTSLTRLGHTLMIQSSRSTTSFRASRMLYRFCPPCRCRQRGQRYPAETSAPSQLSHQDGAWTAASVRSRLDGFKQRPRPESNRASNPRQGSCIPDAHVGNVTSGTRPTSRS